MLRQVVNVRFFDDVLELMEHKQVLCALLLVLLEELFLIFVAMLNLNARSHKAPSKSVFAHDLAFLSLLVCFVELKLLNHFLLLKVELHIAGDHLVQDAVLKVLDFDKLHSLRVEE